MKGDEHMKKVKFTCFRCGTEFERAYPKPAKRRFCSQSCNMKQLNEEMNPTRMDDETKAKVREGHLKLNKGEGKTYKKLHGRHEHRVVAEQKLGRPLKKGEIVHHIDGNKLNNHPDNLEVLDSQSIHALTHVKETGYCAGKKVVMPNGL